MIISPIINGVVARSAHPEGCKQSIDSQIDYVKNAKQIKSTPKRVLILGASSGFGLAARIALTFGGANCDTIGVSFEKGPSEKSVGTAGWYNNIFFKQRAQQAGRRAINIVGDAFSQNTREQVIEAIETYFEGEVDLVIYSLATGVRPKENGEFWKSAIRPVGQSLEGAIIDLEHDRWIDTVMPAATESEIEGTLKVMGGEDWESWVDTLINAEAIAQGCKTIAFSYMGPEVTHPIYLDGTLGRAKIDLHQTSHSLNLEMANFGGSAHATVCKALVTKASVFIPGLSPYILALYKVMKEKGTHENCIAQMQRLFADKLYNEEEVPVDAERLLRMDDLEQDADVQSQVSDILKEMNQANFKELGDYEGFKSDFLQLNGFNYDNIDYLAKTDITGLKKLVP